MDYIANVENSEIDVSGIRTVLVQGDSSYPIIRFVLDPSLTGLSWRVRGTYTDTNIAVLSPEITPTESATAVTLDWSVSSDFTTYDGDMQLVLVGANDTGTTVVKALAEITIQKDWSIGTTATITLNLFEQLMAQANAAISKYPTVTNGNWYVWNVTAEEYQDTGVAASSQWKSGTGITGTSTTPTAFPSSGITMSNVGDMYLNASTSNTYRCTTSGAAAVALWVYVSNIKGATGAAGTGVAAGGTANQFLKKVDGTDYNTQWATLTPALSGLEGVSEIDAIADGDGVVLNDASASAGTKTKFVLWSAIKTALALIFPSSNGWSSANETWAYASASTITVPSGAAAKYAVGDKIKLTQTTVKYFYIVGVSDTVLTVTGGSTYTIAAAAITSPYYSHVGSPNGFPQYFAYTPTGVSATNCTMSCRFSIINRRAFVDMLIDFTGGITFTTMPTLPIPVSASYLSAGVTNAAGVGSYFDLGTLHSPGGLFPCVKASSTTVTITAPTGTAISATSPCTWANGDLIELHFNYEI